MTSEEHKRELIIALINLAMIAGTAWMMTPAHQRATIRMGLFKRAGSLVQRCAQWAGRMGISDELGGDQAGAAARYSLAYRLMAGPYARASRGYDNARGVTP